MSWQNWVVLRMVCNQVKKLIEWEFFDFIVICLYVEKCKMFVLVELLLDWCIVLVYGVGGDGFIGEWIELVDFDLYVDVFVVFYLYGGGYFFCSLCIYCLIIIGFVMYVWACVCVLDY